MQTTAVTELYIQVHFLECGEQSMPIINSLLHGDLRKAISKY
jgi:hypothetical protein